VLVDILHVIMPSQGFIYGRGGGGGGGGGGPPPQKKKKKKKKGTGPHREQKKHKG